MRRFALLCHKRFFCGKAMCFSALYEGDIRRSWSNGIW